MENNSITVPINGKEIGLLFGLLQVKEFELALVGNMDLFFDSKNMLTEAGMAQLIYTANQNHRFLNQGEGLTLEEIYEWLITGRTDKAVMNQLLEILKVWQSSKRVQLWLDDLKKKTEAAKKELENSKQRKRSKANTNVTRDRSGLKGTGRKK